ncbi:MAG: ankyrin repeat domain-containing protein [Pseudomonadota bacterium]
MSELRTPLELATQRGDPAAVVARFEAGDRPSDLNHMGIPVFFDALRSNRLDTLAVFLDAGVDLYLPYNRGGYTPFVYACLYCDIATVRWLHAQLANVDQQTEQGVRGIHVAVQRHDLTVARFLYSQGADLFAPTAKGEPPLLISLRSRHGLAAFMWLLDCYARAGEPLDQLVLPCLAYLLEKQHPDAVAAAAAIIDRVSRFPTETAVRAHLSQPGNYAVASVRPLSDSLESRISAAVFALLRSQRLSRSLLARPAASDTTWQTPGDL